ncbi:hypothetical protein [Marinobacter orientalis]|uniref:Uncharacterized protein n=1 Tax=Marinobacter orientalis TaxID=1928859 RepID=A0A7Y0NK74_9GAMM|nr:hypothetical protein [Marinobacter orientalis]NMT62694.1 hypothetical protein [Marinobacter orientalis]TGX51380.1 hypothetical protein DIT72_04955 [Marinobacter orientalis]
MKWMAILLLITPAIALAETELEFHLCSSYVQESAVGEQTDRGWPVFIKLTELGATSFEKFTETNRSKMSRIVAGGREFLRATIWAPAFSGKLRGTFSSREAATAWERTLADKLPAVPCGARD